MRSVASYGALKTLFTMLSASTSFAQQSVTLAFGEENKIAQEFSTPYVCMVPTTGSYKKDTVGFAKGAFDSATGQYANTDEDMYWPLSQTVELWLWAFDPDPAATAIDHADAAENLRAAVLQAFWDQRPQGLYFEPTGERWATMQDQQNRYGRALVMTVSCDVTVSYLAPVDATVEEVTLGTVTVE